MSERVLISGCGDLGQRLAHRLLQRGDRVWALRRHPPAGDGSDIEWLAGDLTDPDSLRMLPRGITQVVHAPTPDAREAAAYRAVFVNGLRNVLAALEGAPGPVPRVLLVSSSAVYGDHAGGWVDENTAPAPPGFNGEILLQAERWLSAQPLGSVTLRLAGLYGPGRLSLIERLREGKVTVPRGVPHWANRIHIDDAAAAVVHLLALEAPQSLYLGVDDTPLRIDTLYDFLAKLVGAPPPGAGESPRGIGSKRLCNARLRASGWEPQWPDARAGYAALLKYAADPLRRD